MRNGAPYRHVLTHGWTLDAKGQPMSKSLGNVVLPTEICEKWGADLLRLWVASQDYTADVRMSDNVMTQLSEAYRKLRNTFRFALGNLAGFDPARDSVPDAEMEELDRWMLSRTAELVAQCRKWYEGFEFHRVFHALHDFAVVDLSAFYFDVLKDRLYTFAPRNRARRSAQTAMYRIAKALLSLATPIMVFTAEEIWKYFPHVAGDPESAHLALFPKAEALGSSARCRKGGELGEAAGGADRSAARARSRAQRKNDFRRARSQSCFERRAGSGSVAGTIQDVGCLPCSSFRRWSSLRRRLPTRRNRIRFRD